MDAMTLSIKTLRIMTLSVKELIATLRITTLIKCHSA
jgi:hypothetical protein